jgi:hypothetical protein
VVLLLDATLGVQSVDVLLEVRFDAGNRTPDPLGCGFYLLCVRGTSIIELW